MTVVRLEVREHRAQINTRCGLCGDPCQPTGRDPFLAGTWTMVCASCAIAHALDVRASGDQGGTRSSETLGTGEGCAWNSEQSSNVQIPRGGRA